MNIELTINDRTRRFEIAPGAMLVDVLREAGYTEVKKGCDTGSCGVCTVLLDGEPILSCSYFAAKADGHQITTVKGIATEAAEFADHITAQGADQCGFCGPAFALSVHAMKKAYKNPNLDEIKHYLAGNLCRCTGYEAQMRAVKSYMEAKHE